MKLVSFRTGDEVRAGAVIQDRDGAAPARNASLPLH